MESRKITLIVTIFLFANSFLYSQSISESKKVASGKIGVNKWDITETIKNNDTTTYFYFGYQNMKYQAITDLGGLIFSDSLDLSEFVNALDILSKKENKVSVSITFSGGKAYLYDFSNAIYIEDKKGKYTSINKKAAIKFVNEIKQYYKLL